MSLARNVHRGLYREIPAFSGCNGCNDCCGPVPVTPHEAARLGIEGPLTPTLPGTMTCAFSTPAGCSVYDKRPYMCRLFGTADDPRLRCPHGKQPAKLKSAAWADALTTRYAPLMDMRS